ncbi:MAG: hypothetical protein ACK56I_27585, partial [bacterium]
MYFKTTSSVTASWSRLIFRAVDVFCTHGTISVIKDVEIEHGCVGRNLCSHSTLIVIDLRGQAFPESILPAARGSRECQFCTDDFGLALVGAPGLGAAGSLFCDGRQRSSIVQNVVG